VYDHNWRSIAGPLYEGMQFAAAHHTKVAMQLFALWVVVSLAAQSILGACSLTLSMWVLWEKRLPGSRSEQSGVRVLMRLTRVSTTFFFGRRMAEPIWSLIWKRLPGKFG
jgi:hypothetical protein